MEAHQVCARRALKEVCNQLRERLKDTPFSVLPTTVYDPSRWDTFDHYVKTSNRSRSICNGPLTPVTSTRICNGCLVPITYKRAMTTPGLASTTPITNVDFW
jgi:hypothetical protein